MKPELQEALQILKLFFKKTHLNFTTGWVTDEAVMGNLLPGDNWDNDRLGVLLGKEGDEFDRLLGSLVEDEEDQVEAAVQNVNV